MYLRPLRKTRPNGVVEVNWALVESVRTERCPRQRTVAYLGDLCEEARLGVKAAATGTHGYQMSLFDEPVTPQWVEVDWNSLEIEQTVSFGDAWLGHELFKLLRLDACLESAIPGGREDIACAMMAEVLGVPWEKINEQRLYRTLDELLPHKETLEKHLRERYGHASALFKITT